MIPVQLHCFLKATFASRDADGLSKKPADMSELALPQMQAF